MYIRNACTISSQRKLKLPSGTVSWLYAGCEYCNTPCQLSWRSLVMTRDDASAHFGKEINSDSAFVLTAESKGEHSTPGEYGAFAKIKPSLSRAGTSFYAAPSSIRLDFFDAGSSPMAWPSATYQPNPCDQTNNKACQRTRGDTC